MRFRAAFASFWIMAIFVFLTGGETVAIDAEEPQTVAGKVLLTDGNPATDATVCHPTPLSDFHC